MKLLLVGLWAILVERRAGLDAISYWCTFGTVGVACMAVSLFFVHPANAYDANIEGAVGLFLSALIFAVGVVATDLRDGHFFRRAVTHMQATGAAYIEHRAQAKREAGQLTMTDTAPDGAMSMEDDGQ